MYHLSGDKTFNILQLSSTAAFFFPCCTEFLTQRKQVFSQYFYYLKDHVATLQTAEKELDEKLILTNAP